jgi:preprotein translocase subunit SecG
MDKQIIYLIQVILGLILIGLIILQSKGNSLGGSFGGNMSFYSTRRGAEKMMFYLTIVIAAVFLITSLLGVII